MKILTVSTSFPYPPDDGTKIQTYERVRALAENHDLTLLCVSGESISADRIKEMDRYCESVCIEAAPPSVPTTAIGKTYEMLRSVLLREPYYIHDRISGPAQLWLARELAKHKFDVVEADGYANAYLSPSSRALKVAIFHSVSDTCARRELALPGSCLRKSTVNAYRVLTKLYEARVIRAADLCVALTEDNRRDLQHLYPHARVRNCLSNGVDADYFTFQSPTPPPCGICFVGKMDYAPNIDAVLWFSQAILPRVRERLPQFRFVIVGSHPVDAVKALARHPEITITGYVNDIRPYMRQCGVMVIPMRMGGGILNKLLQGLSMGVPIVATSLSLEGLSAVPNRDLLVADTIEDLATSICRLATDEALRLRLASNGRRYIENTHRWSAMVKRYEAELFTCLDERRRAEDNGHLRSHSCEPRW